MDCGISNEFDKLDIGMNDSDIDSNEDRERVEREKELNACLSNAFDDLSSLTDEEEEDRTSDDVLPELNQQQQTKTPANHTNPKLATSTPIQITQQHNFTPFNKPVNYGGDHKVYANNNNEDELLAKLNERDQEILKLRAELDYFKKLSVESNGFKTQLNEARSDVNFYKTENSKLSKAIELLKTNTARQSTKVTDLEQKLTQANGKIEELERDNRALARRLATLRQEIADLHAKQSPHQQLQQQPTKPQPIDLTNYVHKNEVKAAIKTANDLYKKEIDEKLEAVLSEAKDDWNNALQSEINKMAILVESFFKTTVQPPATELQAMLLPLQRLWVAYQNSVQAKMDELSDQYEKVRQAKFELEEKKIELDEAKLELDEALNHSRTETNLSQNLALEELREKFTQLQREQEEQKKKIKRYKEKYFAKSDEFKRTIEALETELRMVKLAHQCFQCTQK